MATLEQALDQMLRRGMPPFPEDGPRVNTPGIVRYGPRRTAWYRLAEFVSAAGRRYISGVYGYWGVIDSASIETDWSGLDETDRARMLKARAAHEQRLKEKAERRARLAAARGRQQFLSASFEGESPYLKCKDVQPERGLRFMPDGTLFVPMYRYDEIQGNGKPKFVGLHKIGPDGGKRFNRGMITRTAAFRLGVAPKDGDTIFIVRDIAAGLSIRAAIDRAHPVYCALDADNVGSLTRHLRFLFPQCALIVCADDDFDVVCPRHLREGATEALDPAGARAAWCQCNPGRSRAMHAASSLELVSVVFPRFANRAARRLVDFNDLHVAEGLDAVRAQLRPVLPQKKAKGKTREPPPELPTEFWPGFLKRYTLIYPTQTAWDAEYEEIVKVSAMYTMWGAYVADRWLQDPKRRTINARDVVFDPSCTCDPERTLNLFTGWAFKPNPKASSTKLRELLQYLCGEEGQEQAPTTEWVEKWIAYPLQNPGAKMRTAVVMRGPEGSGKNMFWGAVSSIYGPYGGLINQFQLQSQFNDWASRKMFIVANEVVTRMEIKHLVGYLKNLVTEPRIPIETKGVPVREEDNRMQLVFLSNELRPLHISPLDRRYAVIKTPGIRPREYYAAIQAEIDADGAAALYQYFLDLDLTGFDEHAKPPLTQAKADLIELGLTSTQCFWQDIHDGLLPLPYASGLVSDYYRGYTRYCARIGEKNPVKRPQFSHEFMSMNGVSRRRGVRLPDPDDPLDLTRESSKWRQRSVFVIGQRPEDISNETLWLSQQVAVWREALKKFGRFGRHAGDDDAADEAERSVREARRNDPAF